MNSIDNSYPSLFKSAAVGAAVSGACLMQEISPTYSVGVGCIAMFGTAFFFRLDKEYKEVFVPNLTRLMQENKSVYIFHTRKDKNADFFFHRMKICSLYRKISAGAFFLKPLGWLKEKEVEILNQLKESKGHFAEKILEKKIEIRDHRFVSDSKRIEEKLDKQLLCAERHRLSQKEVPFTYEEVGDLSDRKFCGFKNVSRELRVKGGMTSDVGISYLQGRKKTQEDRWIAESFEIQDLEGNAHRFMLTGVFDGHNGVGASAFMQDNLAEQLQSSLQEILDRGLELSDLEIWNLLKRVCVELSDIWNAFGTDLSGTTASFSLLKEGEDLWTVNVGDSRSFIASKDKVIQLTEDAKLSSQPILSEEGYRKRILDKKEDENFYETRVWKGNGFVLDSRLDGILAMPRAIGDRQLGVSVSARPKITKIAVSKEFQEGDPCYLFHATDGLWDGVSTNQVAKYLLEFDPIPVEIARRFTYSVGKGCPGDNISVVVAELTGRLADS